MKTKLVRDKIPDIIRAEGRVPVTHTATEQEYKEQLLEKLHEECKEFEEALSSEELADLLEVVYALAPIAGVTKEQLEEIRKKKKESRGAFRDKIILEY